MPITPRIFSAIVSDLRDRMNTSIPALDTSEGTFFRISAVDPISTELLEIENLLLSVQASQSLLTATGVDLDLLAYNYNVFRRGAQSASGFVQIYTPVSSFTTPVTIPAGTIITSKNSITYSTLIDATLNGFAQTTTRNSVSVYQITVPAGCNVIGSTGNASPGTLTTIAFSGVLVTNDAAVQGGFDSESDTSLATRAILSFGIWSKGVKSAVEYGASLVPGVYSANAVYAYAGHFYLYVSDQAGNLTSSMESAINSILVDWAAAGVGWTLLAPPLYLLNTTINVSFYSTTNMDTQLTQVQSDVATVINATTGNTLYLDTFVVSLRNRLSSYVAHFELVSPTEHILEPLGYIIRSGTIDPVNFTGVW